ncbi:MAG: LysR family transcriptional regulator [Pseudomonadota bacterium]|nr:LysR family transcriptional regulator [Pseudomonadota bacterium]
MTELRNFDLNLLRAFKLLVEERSVTRAAEKLFVSQPAMSHVLCKLRRQLDDPILVKTSAGMIPTARARALLEPIRTVLTEVEHIIQPPEEFSPAISQKRFVIATSDYVEFTLFLPLIKSFNKRAPNIEIHVRHQINKLAEIEIEEDHIDLVILFDSILNIPSNICHRKLFDDRIVCIARQDHHEFTGNIMSFEQFISSRHMLISPRGTGTGLIDDYLAVRGLTRKVSLIVPNFLSAPWIVANTDLVLSLPLRIAEQFVRLAPLKILPLPIDLPIYDLIMVWHPRQEKEPAHQWLRREILEICRKMTG